MIKMPITGMVAMVPGREGDLYISVPGGVEDQLEFPSGVDRGRREDIQLWDFLLQVAEAGGVHPLSAEVVPEGDDPPDRFLTSASADRRWATELTELTIGDVRSDLAKVRSFGRDLQDRLMNEVATFAHLRGREVTLSHDPQIEVKLDQKRPHLLDLLATELRVDKGHSEFPADGRSSKARGDYGDIGPFYVIVNDRPEFPDLVIVSAGIQADIFASEIIDALNRRIAAKDHPPNEVLVVSCGLPDPRGYICPLDYMLFSTVQQLSEGGGLSLTAPKHLKGVALHCLKLRPFVQLYRHESETLPWTT